jgi:hypothetical protein
MQKQNKMNKGLIFIIIGLLILLAFVVPVRPIIASSVNYNRPVVLIDVSHVNNDFNYEQFAILLGVWGFQVVWNEDNWTDTTFNDVDILIAPVRDQSNYSANELGNLTNWFNTGNKGIWVGGDSDYYGPQMAYRPNHILNAIGSSIYVECSQVESENNFGAVYRVSGTLYNTDDQNTRYITSGLPYQGDEAMALFHGPAAIIGKNSTGDFVDLEANTLPNVEWVVQTTNATIRNSHLPEESEGALVHANNQMGNFTLMALEHSAGVFGNNKIVVTGEGIFSTYKKMFNDPGEFEVPHNDLYLVYNTMQWFTGFTSDSTTMPVVLIDLAHTYDSFDYHYDKFIDHAVSWGFDIRINSDNITASDLTDVDILIIPSIGGPLNDFNFSTSELGNIANWFDLGNKGIWVVGDSDYYGPSMSYRPNQVLNAIGSSIYVESSSVESEYNFGAYYRVSGALYNTEDQNAGYITSGLPYQGDEAMASFHGPAAVIGKNSTGEYVNLETNILLNVEWVVQAKNATIILRDPPEDVEGAQVHSNNQEGNFTLMALQHSAGGAGTGKIVVSGEAPFSTYKYMFNDPGEYEIPQNDYYLVYNTLNWFAQRTIDQRTIVMIDVAKTNYPTDFLDFATELASWGYDVIWNEDNFTVTSLNTVDILIVPTSTFNYTSSELGYITTWFDSGDKCIWVTGDSDYGARPYWAYRANQVLDAVGSSIYVESGGVVSDYNFGAPYRVSGAIYNSNGTNTRYITERLPLTGTEAMAMFHGPTTVIGKNSTGDFIDLESNNLSDVEWVVKATNGTFSPTTIPSDAEGAQVHFFDQKGDFVLMALQHSAGVSNTGKIIVSGESIFSSYKQMFNQIGEYDIPHNDYFLVANAMNWFAPVLTRPVLPYVYITAPGYLDILRGEFLLEWNSGNFLSPTFKFDVIVDNNVVVTTVGFKTMLNLTSGYHDIMVRETSLQGFVQPSNVIRLFVDNDSPIIDLSSSIANNTSIFSTTFEIEYNFSDSAGSGIASYEFLLDDVFYANGTALNATGTLIVSNLVTGTHAIRIIVFDEAGNSAEAKYNFIVIIDNVAPLITLSSTVANDTSTSSTSIEIEYNFSDSDGSGIVSYEFLLDDVFFANGTALNATGTLIVSDLDAGAHTIRVIVFDETGNSAGAIYSIFVVIDNEEPLTTLSSTVANDTSTSSTSIEIEYNFSDGDGSGIATFVFLLDDVFYANGTTSNATGILILFDLSIGSHTIRVIVLDEAGNSAEATYVFLVVADNEPPLIILSSTVANDTSTLSTSIEIEYILSDGEGSGIDSFEFFLDDVFYANGTASNATGTLSISGLSIGSHIIHLIVLDEAGNSAEASYVFLVVSIITDNDAPLISLSCTIANETSSFSTTIEIEYNFSDGDGSGIASYEIKLDGVLYAIGTASNATGTLTLPDLSLGSHTIQAIVLDEAGNSAEVIYIVLITADTDAPIITLSSIVANDTSTSATTVEIGYILSDGDGSGIASFEFFLDGSSYIIGTATSAIGTLMLSDLNIGIHLVLVVVYDETGNSAEASFYFSVIGDTIAPLISFSSTVTNGTSTVTTTIAIEYNFSDGDGSGIASFEFFLDGVSYISGAATSATGTLTLSDLSIGSHTIRVVVFDEEGNSAEGIFIFTIEESSSSTSSEDDRTSFSSSEANGFEILLFLIALFGITCFRRKYNT